MPELLTLLGMLAAVAAVLLLAYFATRWIAKRGIGGIPGAGTGADFCVLRQIVVGRSEKLLLVRLKERCLLLGVTAGGISVLRELPPEEASCWTQPRQGPEAPPSFLEILKQNLKKKK